MEYIVLNLEGNRMNGKVTQIGAARVDEKLDVLECLRPMPGADVMVLSGDSAPDWKYAVEQRSLDRVLDRLRERFDHVIRPCCAGPDGCCMWSGATGPGRARCSIRSAPSMSGT